MSIDDFADSKKGLYLFNRERMEDLFDRFYAATKLKENAPELIAPEYINTKEFESGSLAESLVLTTGMMIDGGKQSKDVYEASRDMIMHHSPAELFQMSEFKLTELIGRYLYNNKKTKDAVLFNYNLLKKEFKGDPRQILNGKYTYHDALKIVMQFDNIGVEIGTLMINNFHRFGYTKITDAIPLKCDLHLLRMSYGHGLFEPKIKGNKNGYHRGAIARQHKIGMQQVINDRNVEDYHNCNDVKLKCGELCKEKSFNACKNCILDCKILIPSLRDLTYLHLDYDIRNKNEHKAWLEFEPTFLSSKRLEKRKTKSHKPRKQRLQESFQF